MKKSFKKLLAVVLMVVLCFTQAPLIGLGAKAAQITAEQIYPYVYLNAEKATETIKMSGVSYYDAIVFRMGYTGLSTGYMAEVNYNLQGDYKKLSFDAGYTRGDQRDAKFTVKFDGVVELQKTIKYTDIAETYTFNVDGVSQVSVIFETSGYDGSYYAIGDIKFITDKEIEEREPLTSNIIKPYQTTNATEIKDAFSMGGVKYKGGYELRMGYTGNSSTGGMAQMVFNFQGNVDYMSFDICQYKENLRYNRNCTMKITADGEVIYDSEVITWNGIPKHYTLNLTGVKQLIIRTESAGYDGMYYRIANMKADKCEHRWTLAPEGGLVCDICSEDYFFKFGEDNFSFTNEEHGTSAISEIGYAYSNPFRIDLISFIHESVTNNDYKGACFGLACMNAAFYGGMSPSDFGASTVSTLGQTLRLTDAVNLMLASQISLGKGFQELFSFSEFNQANYLKKIVQLAENIEEGEFLPIVQFSYYDGENKYCNHGVNIIGMLPEDTDKNYYAVLLNDSNYLDFPSLFLISKDYKNASFAAVSEVKSDSNGKEKVEFKYTYDVASINNIITNENYNIDRVAPGLRTDALGLYRLFGEKSIGTSATFGTYASRGSEDEQYRKDHIMFVVDNKAKIQIKSGSGKTIDINAGKVVNTTYAEIGYSPIMGTDLIKVVVKKDSDIYRCISDGAFYLYINNDGKIGVVESDKAADVVYTTSEKITLNPINSTVNYKIGFYEENIIKNSDAVGVITSSTTNKPVTINCAGDNVTVNRKEAKKQTVTICEFKDDITEKTCNIDKYENSLITTNSNATSYIVSETVSNSVESVSLEDVSLNYKDSYTLNPQIIIDGSAEYTVSYESSDSDVVTVDENGNLTTRGTGNSEITVTVTDTNGNVVQDTCTVNVSYSWWQWIIIIVLFGWIWY